MPVAGYVTGGGAVWNAVALGIALNQTCTACLTMWTHRCNACTPSSLPSDIHVDGVKLFPCVFKAPRSAILSTLPSTLCRSTLPVLLCMSAPNVSTLCCCFITFLTLFPQSWGLNHPQCLRPPPILFPCVPPRPPCPASVGFEHWSA